MTPSERLYRAAVWHLEEPSGESRQALADAVAAFAEWDSRRDGVTRDLFAARRVETDALLALVNEGLR